jgi:hypothetical protein
MQELGVDAMETFQDAVELAGPVMDNVNRAGMHGCMCGCMRVRLCLCVMCVCDGCVAMYV